MIGWNHMQPISVNGRAPGSASTDTQIPERPTRRRFTIVEKRRILAAADACEPGTLGSLLRREGIYSSLLAAWRKQRDRGYYEDDVTNERASSKSNTKELELRNASLERENRKLNRQLRRAELIMDIQKKAAGLVGIELESPESNEND